MGCENKPFQSFFFFCLFAGSGGSGGMTIRGNMDGVTEFREELRGKVWIKEIWI